MNPSVASLMNLQKMTDALSADYSTLRHSPGRAHADSRDDALPALVSIVRRDLVGKPVDGMLLTVPVGGSRLHTLTHCREPLWLWASMYSAAADGGRQRSSVNVTANSPTPMPGPFHRTHCRPTISTSGAATRSTIAC